MKIKRKVTWACHVNKHEDFMSFYQMRGQRHEIFTLQGRIKKKNNIENKLNLTKIMKDAPLKNLKYKCK